MVFSREMNALRWGFAAVVGVGIARAETTFYAARVAPIFEQHCVTCHGAEKHKAKLRLDSFAQLMKGGDSGLVIKPGAPKASELFRRITLPEDDDEVMPSDGKPHLSTDEIKVIELWIARGASEEKNVAEFSDAPPLRVKQPIAPLAPDWLPRAAEIVALEKETGVKLVPRSQIGTDGLILRTASRPTRCDDAALAKLTPVADLIVDAELARTKVTDAGVKTLGTFRNLRALDLTSTKITSSGLAALTGLSHLETLNLTGTAVDDSGVAQLKALPTLQHLWLFGTKVATPESSPNARTD
jgi:mono/diheme cytochrome c family protein